METLAFHLVRKKNFKNLFSISIGKVNSNQIKFIQFINNDTVLELDVEKGILKFTNYEFPVSFLAVEKDSVWTLAEQDERFKGNCEIEKNTRELLIHLGCNEIADTTYNLNYDTIEKGSNLATIWTAFYPGNINYYVVENGDEKIYMYILDVPSEVYQSITIHEFEPRIMDIIGNYDVDYRLMIKSFIINNGSIFEIDDNDNIIGTFNNNLKIRFNFVRDNYVNCERIKD